MLRTKTKMEHPPLPDPEQMKLWGANSGHHFLHPKVVELKLVKAPVEHDPIIDGLEYGCEIIEFPTKEEPPDLVA